MLVIALLNCHYWSGSCMTSIQHFQTTPHSFQGVRVCYILNNLPDSVVSSIIYDQKLNQNGQVANNQFQLWLRKTKVLWDVMAFYCKRTVVINWFHQLDNQLQFQPCARLCQDKIFTCGTFSALWLYCIHCIIFVITRGTSAIMTYPSCFF